MRNTDHQSQEAKANEGHSLEEISHTPGPWNIHLDITQTTALPIIIKNDSGDFIARVRHAKDARLIATAPELLEALKQINSNAFCAGVDEGYTVLQKVQRIAHAAIAKATGK